MSTELTKTSAAKAGGGWKVLALIAMALGGAVAIGIVPKLEQHDARAEVAALAARPPRVRVSEVRPGDAEITLTLPATSAPQHVSVLYSKSTGFVRKNLVDIGDRVKAGQLLAEVDAPESTEEIRLARARLNEARANVGLVETTSHRLAGLARDGNASQQEADDALAQANSASALVATRKADLQRLEALRDYQQIVAPFAGVVTRRLVDAGALVGPASAGGVPMFEVADVSVLRVAVDVPDSYASEVGVGVEAEVYSPREPTRRVRGKVVRTAGALEATTRTLRVEIDVPGDAGLLPGAFAYVDLAVPRRAPPPRIPASALVVRKQGTLVARVDGDTVTMAEVVLGRDFGKEIEILGGITAGDRVILQPPDTLETGDVIEVAPTAS